MVIKTCRKCKQDKAAEDFYKGRRECKECYKEYQKAHYKRDAEKKKEYSKAYYKQNAEKRKEYDKAYYKRNAEKRKEYHKAHYKRNSEKRKERNKAYQKQNRDKIRIHRNKRRKTDPNFKLSENLRTRVRRVLNGNSKSQKTLKLLGCSVDFFKKHLESQFEPGMSWNNYGNPNGDHSECWHVDHVVPCASFDFSDPEQQQKCFHYSNLQPLWAKDNISKGANLHWAKL